MKTQSVRLSQEQLEALQRCAEEDKRIVSQVIRIALDEFFERQPEIKIPEIAP
jgi:predicted transcriptional regulator